MNTTFVFEPFLLTDGYLCGQTVVNGVDRRANDGRELRANKDLPADNDKDSVLFGITSRGSGDAVELTSPQSST